MDLEKRIRELAEQRTLPDGGAYAALPLRLELRLAAEHGATSREVQAAALRAGVMPERYVRSHGALSTDEQLRLLEAQVLLVGLGGLGGYLLESLTRMGVGGILAADGDVFEESNLNRQALSTQERIDTPKTDAALDRVLELNDAVDLAVLDEFLDADAFAALSAEADLVIDALGGLADRQALHEAAAKAERPLVTAAVAGWTGIVAFVPPGEPGPAQLFGSGKGAEDTLGCPAPTVATAASIQAAWVVQALAGREVSARALVFDLADNTFMPVTF